MGIKILNLGANQNISWHSKKPRIINVEKRGQIKSCGAIWIRMCGYNLKNPNLGAFLKERGQNKKNLSLHWKML